MTATGTWSATTFQVRCRPFAASHPFSLLHQRGPQLAPHHRHAYLCRASSSPTSFTLASQRLHTEVLILTGKPEPHNEMPQAQTAHDNCKCPPHMGLQLTPGSLGLDLALAPGAAPRLLGALRPRHPALVPAHPGLWREQRVAPLRWKALTPRSLPLREGRRLVLVRQGSL